MYVMTYTLLCALHEAGRKCYDHYMLQIFNPRMPGNRAGRTARAKLAAEYTLYREQLRSVRHPFRGGPS